MPSYAYTPDAAAAARYPSIVPPVTTAGTQPPVPPKSPGALVDAILFADNTLIAVEVSQPDEAIYVRDAGGNTVATFVPLAQPSFQMA